MGSSGLLCPSPVGSSMPPGSLLVARSSGHLGLVVSVGGFPGLNCQCAFGVGWGLLHFSSLLSDFTFVVFAAVSTAVVSLRVSEVLVSPTLTSVNLEFLRWAVTLHLVLAPRFIVRCNSILPASWSKPSQIWCPHGVYVEFHSVFRFLSGPFREARIRVCYLSSPRLLLMGEEDMVSWVPHVLRFSIPFRLF